MSVSPQEVRERVGTTPDAEFEVFRGTDTETVTATPREVLYGATARTGPYGVVYTPLPMVVFQFSKYHAGLPPWDILASFTLHGDDIAEFDAPEHIDTKVTGELKSVHVAARKVEFKKNEFQVK